MLGDDWPLEDPKGKSVDTPQELTGSTGSLGATSAVRT